MFLRKGRLGEISEDVLEFISSREADRWIFEADLLVDRAHLVMLKEQGLITPEELSRIVGGLEEIVESKLGEGEDVHEAIEAELISRVGAVGGKMHTGRSRNDEVATCIRIVLREEILSLMAQGKTNPQIAGQLIISPSTVNFHVHNILTKLQVQTRTEAVAVAIQNKLIDT